MAKISKNISERILMTGDYYLNNHPGGISAVVAYWSRNFENLQYYPIYKNGGKMTKGWWFVTSYLRLAFRMMWTGKSPLYISTPLLTVHSKGTRRF